MYMTFDLSKKKIYVCVFFMRLNSVRSWRKALLLRKPMKTGHVILLQDIHSSTSLFFFFFSFYSRSLCNSLLYSLNFQRQNFYYLSLCDWFSLTHKKSANPKQRSSNTQKVSNFPFHWFIHLHFVLNKSK